MKFLKILIFAFVVLFLWSFNSFATPILDNGYEPSLQDILDGITVSGPSSVDASGVDNDALDDNIDSYWGITGSSSTVSTFIIEITGNAANQTFGIYDVYDPTLMVEIFSGSVDNSPGFDSSVTISMLADGSIGRNGMDTNIDFSTYSFGYYLGLGDGNYFYSDTGLNADQFDHMVAFQGTGDLVQIPGFSAGSWTDNEYILAWEDAYGGGDQDYQDMVVMVESVQPIPEPATMLLLGSGLIGLAGFGRKRFFKKG